MNGIGNSIGRSLELKDIVLTSAPSGNEWIWWAAAAAAIVLVAVQLLRAVPFSHARRELRRIRKSSSFSWIRSFSGELSERNSLILFIVRFLMLDVSV